MSKQLLGIFPKTILGKLSVGLIPTMFIFLILGTSLTNSIYKSTPAGGTILADIIARPALAISMLTGMIAGISSFTTGLLAIFRHKEKAILVYISTIIGAILILFLAEEFTSPH